MRVLQVVPTYLPARRYGGPIYSVHGLAKGLVANGLDVDICTTNVDGDGQSSVPLDTRTEVDGVGVYYFESRYFRRLYYSTGMARFLEAQISDYDLVHLHSVFLWPTWKASRVAHHSSIPSVLSPRGMLVPALVRARSRWVKTAWIKTIETENLQRATGIHVTSRLELQEAQNYLPKACTPTMVVPNGVENCETRENLPVYESRDVVLCLGRVNWKKNLGDVLRAVQPLSDIKLTIAGPGEEDELSRLARLADELGMSHRVEFLGQVDADIKKALFNRSRMLVLNSLNENFGNVVVEAMAHGCPVVTNSYVGAAEVVSEADAGEISDGSVSSLERCIDKLWNDQERWYTAQGNGLDAVRSSYLWPTLALQMREFYSRVLDA